jgi:hypothetical protein
MIGFRDRTAVNSAELIVYANQDAKTHTANPFRFGTSRCCVLLKTKALRNTLTTKPD